MADEEHKAVIVLTAGKPIRVQSTVAEITNAIADSPRGEMSFMKVIDEHGSERWINVREIVEFHEPVG
jgi:hypothetical protein